jgi:hypothetical protein
MRSRTVLASDAGDAVRAEKPGRPRRARAACERTDLVIVGVCGFSEKLVRVYGGPNVEASATGPKGGC